MDKISILLRVLFEGLPPSANEMYRTGRYSSRYKRPEVAEWQNRTAEQIHKAWGNNIYTGTISLSIEFHTADRRRWDLDNRVKPLIDCLMFGEVIKDDSQVNILHVERYYSKKTMTKLEVSTSEYKRA